MKGGIPDAHYHGARIESVADMGKAAWGEGTRITSRIITPGALRRGSMH
jgi:hypothetical protein